MSVYGRPPLAPKVAITSTRSPDRSVPRARPDRQDERPEPRWHQCGERPDLGGAQPGSRHDLTVGDVGDQDATEGSSVIGRAAPAAPATPGSVARWRRCRRARCRAGGGRRDHHGHRRRTDVGPRGLRRRWRRRSSRLRPHPARARPPSPKYTKVDVGGRRRSRSMQRTVRPRSESTVTSVTTGRRAVSRPGAARPCACVPPAAGCERGTPRADSRPRSSATASRMRSPKRSASSSSVERKLSSTRTRTGSLAMQVRIRAEGPDLRLEACAVEGRGARARAVGRAAPGSRRTTGRGASRCSG